MDRRGEGRREDASTARSIHRTTRVRAVNETTLSAAVTPRPGVRSRRPPPADDATTAFNRRRRPASLAGDARNKRGPLCIGIRARSSRTFCSKGAEELTSNAETSITFLRVLSRETDRWFRIVVSNAETGMKSTRDRSTTR